MIRKIDVQPAYIVKKNHKCAQKTSTGNVLYTTHRFGVAAETVLQQPGELGVSVGHVRALGVDEGLDHVTYYDGVVYSVVYVWCIV